MADRFTAMSSKRSPPIPPTLDDLNDRQRAFVFAFVCGDTAGNASASYRAAGYKGARQGSDRLLNDWRVCRAIEDLKDATIKEAERLAILTPAERLTICAEIARDPELPPRARLAAIRLDAELRGGFKEIVEKREIIVDLVTD